MAQFRGVISFGFLNAGWSEVYYPIGPDSTTATANMLTVYNARKACLPSLMRTVRCTISEVSVRGDVYLVASGANGTFTTTAVAPIDTCAMYSFYGGSVLAARHYVRGVDASALDGNGEITASTYLTAVDAWASAVASNCLGRHRLVNPTPPPAFNYTYVGITTFSFTKTGFRKVGRPFDLPVGRRRIA